MLVGFLQPHFEICYQTWSKQSGSRLCIYRLPERFPSQLASVSDRWAWHCSCWVVLRCYCKPVSTTATVYPCRAGLSVESLLTPLCEGLRGASPPLLLSSLPENPTPLCCWGNTILPIRHGMGFLRVAEHTEQGCAVNQKHAEIKISTAFSKLEKAAALSRFSFWWKVSASALWKVSCFKNRQSQHIVFLKHQKESFSVTRIKMIFF